MVPVRAVTATLLHPLGEVQYETHSLDVNALACPRCSTPMLVLAPIYRTCHPWHVLPSSGPSGLPREMGPR